MSEISGSQFRNLTESQAVQIGVGKVYGFIVNSHTSGTIKLQDGVDGTAGAKATSTLTTSGIVYAKFPQSVITSNATNVSEDDTVTIGSTVYRFKATPIALNDIDIGASAAATLDNLKEVINGTYAVGIAFLGTVINPDVTATTNTDTTQLVVSKVIGTANNTKATTETAVTLSWADTTLGGGTGTSVTGVATASSTFVINGTSYYFTNQLSETVNGVASAVANQILWVTSDAVALDNMKLAINGSGTEGTSYSTGTNANPDVIATTNANTTQIIEARVFGTLGNEITTTETMTTTAWTGATLSGGTSAARLMLNTITLAAGPQTWTFPAPIYFVNGLFVTLGGTGDVTILFS